MMPQILGVCQGECQGVKLLKDMKSIPEGALLELGVLEKRVGHLVEPINAKVRSAAASRRGGRVEGQALDPRSRRVTRMARAMPGDEDRVAVRSLAALGLDCPLENLRNNKHTIICLV